jgi:5-methylthioadenosine/S-adenosylhomocysteine deaminase
LTQQLPDLLATAGAVITMDERRRVWHPGFVSVREGVITAVGPLSESPRDARRHIHSPTGIVIPGLVNCHTHLSRGVNRGFFDELSLDDWIRYASWPTVRTMTEARCYAGARLSLSELLRGGVTTTVSGEYGQPDHRAIDGVLRAVQESGVRAVVSRMAINSDDASIPAHFVPDDLRDGIASATAEVHRLRSRWNSHLVEVVPEALGVLRCTPEMVVALCDQARVGEMRMLMHVASSAAEVASCRRKYGVGCIELLAKMGVLGPHLLIAHCVWPSPPEIRILADTATGVSHNPVSNLSYATGIAPLPEMLDAGVRVGLGVDGAATNNGQNLWETMKMAMFLQKQRRNQPTWGSAELALELATLGGARALGMDHMIGSLEPGKRADLAVVEANDAGLAPFGTAVSSMVYSASPRAVQTVVVDGRVLVDGGRLTVWDHDDVIAESRTVALEWIDAAGIGPLFAQRTKWLWNDGIGPQGLLG